MSASMRFGEAFTALAEGARIARQAWSSTGASLRLIAGGEGQPQRFIFNRNGGAPSADAEVTSVPLADFLAEDWIVVDTP